MVVRSIILMKMTVTSFAPGQMVHVEPNPEVTLPKWTAIVFHPTCLTVLHWVEIWADMSFSTMHQMRRYTSLR